MSWFQEYGSRCFEHEFDGVNLHSHTLTLCATHAMNTAASASAISVLRMALL